MERAEAEKSVDEELDPRIQIELENLNTATDEINRLEIELDEANTTFRMLLNESTRRLKLLSKKLGGCIERARPYFEAVEIAKKAQAECQKAAVLFQRANEIHAAAKETVALAEQRFMTNQHEWQFDNAWQEMLNHATIKVMDAENNKAESGREHQKRAMLFHAAEQNVQKLEERLHRSINKARPYFEEKSLCQDQLNTQKERIESLQRAVAAVKCSYSSSLKQLEAISEEIHRKRGKCGAKITSSSSSPSLSLTPSAATAVVMDDCGSPDSEELPPPCGPREPGVGAEFLAPDTPEKPSTLLGSASGLHKSSLPDFQFELDRCEVRSCGSLASSSVSERDETEIQEELDVDELKQKVKQLALRPVEGGEGKSSDELWESELKASVNKLDHILMMQECTKELSETYVKGVTDVTEECPSTSTETK